MGEAMLRISTPNFIAVSQMVYDKSVTKNFQTKSKLDPNHTAVWWDKNVHALGWI